jgi:C1A family cysteine protease
MNLTNYTMDETNTTNFITPVKNQMRCGACYAFSMTALYEASIMVFSKGAYNVSLSEAHTMLATGFGCPGGSTSWVTYIMSTGKYGIPLS